MFGALMFIKHHISFRFNIFFSTIDLSFFFPSLSFLNSFFFLFILYAIHLYSLLAIYSNVIIKQAITIRYSYALESICCWYQEMFNNFFLFSQFLFISCNLMRDLLSAVAWNLCAWALLSSFIAIWIHTVIKEHPKCWYIVCFIRW